MFEKTIKTQVTPSQVRNLIGTVLELPRVHTAPVSLRNGAQLIAEKEIISEPPRGSKREPTCRWKYSVTGTEFKVDEALAFANDRERVEKEKDYTRHTAEEKKTDRLKMIAEKAGQNRKPSGRPAFMF